MVSNLGLKAKVISIDIERWKVFPKAREIMACCLLHQVVALHVREGHAHVIPDVRGFRIQLQGLEVAAHGHGIVHEVRVADAKVEPATCILGLELERFVVGGDRRLAHLLVPDVEKVLAIDRGGGIVEKIRSEEVGLDPRDVAVTAWRRQPGRRAVTAERRRREE